MKIIILQVSNKNTRILHELSHVFSEDHENGVVNISSTIFQVSQSFCMSRTLFVNVTYIKLDGPHHDHQSQLFGACIFRQDLHV